MEESKKELMGSKSRDLWRYLHKRGRKDFYGLDIDFVFASKYPVPRVVGFIDVKNLDDGYTFVEVLVYNILRNIAPFYIVYMDDVNAGVFDIYLYKGGDFRPFPPVANDELIMHTNNWDEYFAWEEQIRKAPQ